MNLHRVPVLMLHPKAWQKMLTFVQLCPVEINGWAYVRRLDQSTLYVGEDDVFITEQEVTAGSAEVRGDTTAMALHNAMLDGRAEELKLQWHSHVNGTAKFSMTDTNTMDRYEVGGAEWMVSVVLNKHGHATARLDLYTPLRASLDLWVVLQQLPDKQLVEDCTEDMLKLVSVVRPLPPPPGKRPQGYVQEYVAEPLEEKRLQIVNPQHITIAQPD